MKLSDYDDKLIEWYRAGKTTAEISGVLGYSTGAITGRISRLRKQGHNIPKLKAWRNTDRHRSKTPKVQFGGKTHSLKTTLCGCRTTVYSMDIPTVYHQARVHANPSEAVPNPSTAPRHKETPEANRLLMLAVVNRAIQDAYNRDCPKPKQGKIHINVRKAREWLTYGGRDFRDICNSAGLNPDKICAESRKMAADGWPIERMKAAQIEALCDTQLRRYYENAEAL